MHRRMLSYFFALAVATGAYLAHADTYTATNVVVAPLTSAHWTQGAPYNMYTPHSSWQCGCEAISSSQEFLVWKWPWRLGAIHTASHFVYMNARCYNASISDALKAAVYLDGDGNICTLETAGGGFDYKKSPFQTNGGIILEGIFATTGGVAAELLQEMEGYKKDREAKGHFAYPCAGSVFKNNRAFGLPSGKIIDNLGLRGYTVGGAKISEHHANIIVNCGNATAQDVKDLVDLIQVRVKEATGFQLEREIIYV